MANIKLLDCTLRDGAYIVNANFETHAIKGIIKKMQDANVDIIECGWLKDAPHKEGTSFYHVPQDLEKYLIKKSPDSIYTVMIDWDRYDLSNLTECDGKTVDAVRIVFPKNKFHEAIPLGKIVKDKGYKLFFQAANTLGYSNDELIELAREINKMKPDVLSVVDTFGAMYSEDLDRIITILDEHLDKEIGLGFHSHNNQQLSFSLSIQFVEKLKNTQRNIVVDSSLCGMGRGAGNTTTELMANWLNRKCKSNYDMNIIMDAIDTYMGYFISNYSWGYSIPYFISGMYSTHVNNIAYLTLNHRTNAKDMRIVIESLSEEERIKYDYDLLESKFLDYQNKNINDDDVIEKLRGIMYQREVLIISPGKSIVDNKDTIQKYISENNPIVIGINAICPDYKYDYLFFSNNIRYDYALEMHKDLFVNTNKIVVSSIKADDMENTDVVNFGLLIKRGWEHFDNAVIMFLRLLNRLHINNVTLAGFDGFSNNYSESYFDVLLPSLNPKGNWNELNNEIKSMFDDFKEVTSKTMNIKFLTKSIFDK